MLRPRSRSLDRRAIQKAGHAAREASSAKGRGTSLPIMPNFWLVILFHWRIDRPEAAKVVAFAN